MAFLFLSSLLLPAHSKADLESGNYRIEGEVIGPGGPPEGSANYSLLDTIGDALSGLQQSGSYQVGSGFTLSIQADVPPAPTFSNPATYYNKLQFVVNPSDNPADAEFALAVSDDDFATTLWIQANDTLGANPVWQTYTNWGGASGETLLGLNSDTTYKIKAKARHGDFTETGFGPTASAATVLPQLTFDLDVGDGAHTNTNAPYSISLGTLVSTSVTTQDTSGVSEIYIDVTSNAEDGAVIRVQSSNGNLSSASTGDNLPSSSTTLATGSVNGGYGLAADEFAAATSGTLSEVAPFNVYAVSAGVGGVTTSWQDIFNSSAAPITGGNGVIAVRAVAGTTTSATSDYADMITFIAIPAY